MEVFQCEPFVHAMWQKLYLVLMSINCCVTLYECMKLLVLEVRTFQRICVEEVSPLLEQKAALPLKGADRLL